MYEREYPRPFGLSLIRFGGFFVACEYGVGYDVSSLNELRRTRVAKHGFFVRDFLHHAPKTGLSDFQAA